MQVERCSGDDQMILQLPLCHNFTTISRARSSCAETPSGRVRALLCTFVEDKLSRKHDRSVIGFT